ncbi:phage scaffolding protein [Salinicoccus roseus]|uniref:phage scaffolding protein n=1 Tax=Salinicoccus roseus TaxID=45670 RepID=UPI0035699628
MNIKELLEKLANGELTQEQVETQLNDALDEAKEGMVPRSRLNDKNQEIQDLQNQIEERDGQIETLKNSVEDDSELQQQIQDLQTENQNWSEKYSKSQLNSAIKLAVAKDANDANDVLALLDKEGLELDEDGETVKGLDDKVTALRESKPYLFQTQRKRGRTPEEGNEPPGTLSKSQIMQIQDPKERQKAIKENMQLFD